MYTTIKPDSATTVTQDRPTQSCQNITRTSGTCESVPAPNPNPRDQPRRSKAKTKGKTDEGEGEGSYMPHDLGDEDGNSVAWREINFVLQGGNEMRKAKARVEIPSDLERECARKSTCRMVMQVVLHH